MENKNTTKTLILLIALFIGILVALELCIVYYKANFVVGASQSFCAINDVIDCDAVARTPESRFLGIPNSLFGLGFYCFLFLLSSFELLKENKLYKKHFGSLNNPISYVFSFSIISIVISAILAFISEFIIHKICLLCFVTYAINMVIFFVSKGKTSMSTHLKTTYEDFLVTFKQPFYKFLLITASLLGITTLAFINYFDIFNPQSPIYYSNTAKLYNTTGNILGDKHPKVVLHVYTDFQCPYCVMTNGMIDRLLTEVNGVAVIHHDYPLDASCNPNIKKGLGHKDSCKYSLYSIASKKQGKYLKFNSMLFKNSTNLSDKLIIENSKKLGINYDQLKKDAVLPETKKALSDDVKSAIDLGIDATPTMRIGMKIQRGMLPYYELKQFVINEGGIPKND